MALVPLDLIDLPDDNVRRRPASPAADAALEASVGSMGLLQPVLLRPNANRYVLVAGRRRFRAARNLGLAQIPAHVETNFPGANALAAAAAENMVREAMEPLDQWRAMRDLQAAGFTLSHAAAALGLSDRQARRLDKLSRLHPDVIAEIERFGLPDADELAVIASAPPEQQHQAIVDARRGDSEPDEPAWYMIANKCDTTRISRAHAMFDVETAGVDFEEDLFAEPGSEDAVYTTDTAGFIEAQKVALQARVAREAAAGKKIKLATWKNHALALPKGYVSTHGDPSKPTKKQTVFIGVVTSGYHIGRVDSIVALPAKAEAEQEEPAPSEAKPTRKKAAPAPTPAPAAEPEPDRDPLTAAGRDLIARAKTQALTHHLQSRGAHFDASILLAYLVLALTADNVRVSDPNTKRRIHLADYAPQIVPPQGAAGLDAGNIARVAAAVLADILIAPDSRFAPEPVVEWIGHHTGADAALPRFDTPDILATVSTAELTKIATAAGLKPMKTASGLRKQLAGALPNWRPPGAEFGAPGPTPRDTKEAA